MKTWVNVNAIYQIYPRSFYDTNADGIGDLKGIIKKLDHLKGSSDSLGVDAIWISPFYPSPMADFGYDVSDYRDVHPIFGSLDDFKKLLDEAHERGLKVIVDFVPNHTSDQHPWFQEALRDKHSPYRDYYVWKDPLPDGGVPNNWVGIFGSSMWEYDQRSKQYYLHSFLKEQPDLNWENQKVREEMRAVLRFWLELGVDGFRVDAIRHIAKDVAFRDEPPNPNYIGPKGAYGEKLRIYSKYGPQLFDYLREMADVVEEYPDKLMILEAFPDPDLGSIAEQCASYYKVNPRVALPFNFGGMFLPWGAKPMGDFFRNFQSMLAPGDRPVYCFSNHDQPRIASRFGRRQARLVAMQLLTLPGIPTIYYGDEIAMENVKIPSEQQQDPVRSDNLMGGRDPERTPMQWTNTAFAGFSAVTPWLPVSKRFSTHNVQRSRKNKNSIFALYRQLLALRDIDETLIKGDFEELLNDEKRNVLIYKRSYTGLMYLVALNFSKQYRRVILAPNATVVSFTSPARKPIISKSGTVLLGPYAGVVVKI